VFPALELVRRRHALVLANPELQERELIKLASVATALSEALRRRGVSDTAAELAAETAVTVLRIALTRWIEDPAQRPLEIHVHETIDNPCQLTCMRTVPLKPDTASSSSSRPPQSPG
jgi:energy-converting hydrogenase Eha subunit G